MSYLHILYAISIFSVSHSYLNWVCLSCWLLLNIQVVHDIFLITIFFLFNMEVVKIKFRKHRNTRALMTPERLVSVGFLVRTSKVRMELMKQRIALRGNYSDAELANPITI